MTIASEITRINNNISAAYSAAENKGATLPTTQNSANLATCIASISSGGSGNIVTATNNSSYNRITGEKIWLSKSGNNYSIIDYASADMNSIIGVCKQNIAIGVSGSVETLDDGFLVPHTIRDFITGSGITSTMIDDNAKLLTLDFNGSQTESGMYICSSQLDIPRSTFSPVSNRALVRLKFKFENLNENQTLGLNDLVTDLHYLTSVDNTSYNPQSEYLPGQFKLENTQFNYKYYNNNTTSVNLVNPKEVGTLLKWNTWIVNDMWYGRGYASSNSYVYNNDYSSTSNASYGMMYSSGTNIKRWVIGLNTPSVSMAYRLVIDLGATKIVDANGNVLWTPYKETVG